MLIFSARYLRQGDVLNGGWTIHTAEQYSKDQMRFHLSLSSVTMVEHDTVQIHPPGPPLTSNGIVWNPALGEFEIVAYCGIDERVVLAKQQDPTQRLLGAAEELSRSVKRMIEIGRRLLDES